MIGLVYVDAHQNPPSGAALELELKAWSYALEEVPTHHIATLAQRALRNKRDDFPLRSSQLLREWDVLRDELRQQADNHSAEQYQLLRAGQGTLDGMTVDDWKARHNLPAEWKLGDRFPPESDLYAWDDDLLERRKAVLKASEPRFPAENWDPKWYKSARIREALGE